VTSGRLRKRTRFYDPDDEELLRRVCLASVVDHEQHTDKPSLRGCLARREQSAPEAPDVIELSDDSSDSAPPVGVPMQLDESAFRLSERGATFIAPRTSAAAQRRLADLVAEFGQFAQRANFTLTSAPFDVMIDFGAALVARAVAPRTILELLHTVERRRQAASAPPWALHVVYATYTRRVYRSQPVPQRSPAQEPISIARLVSELPSDNSFASLRLRALLLLCCTSMLRPGEPWTISRRSLHVFQPPGLSPPRLVLGFAYRSKQSESANRALDSNHVEFLPAGSEVPLVFCPARQLLKWRELVDKLPLSHTHDRLFVDQRGRALARDSVRRIVTDFTQQHSDIMHGAASHELRAATAVLLENANVPPKQILRRGAWTDKTDNRVFQGHYTRHRLVATDMASVVLAGAEVRK
jgi:hypothetical protein